MVAHNEAEITMVEMDAEVLPNIDLEGPVPLEDLGTVEVNDILNPFSPFVFQELRSAINPLNESQTFAIDIYADAIDVLQRSN